MNTSNSSLKDNHKTCGLKKLEMYIKRRDKEITEEEFAKWYKKECLYCKYNNEVGCMYGEE